MTREHQTVIGMNPGSRYLGIAVIRDGDLREWGVKVFRGKQPRKKLENVRKVILQLIDLYGPTALSIKELHPSRRSPHLQAMVKMLKEIARTHKIAIFQYSIEALKGESAGTEAVNNKRKLTETTVARFPILFHELNREAGHKNPYYVRMFEAVSLAAACFGKIGTSPKNKSTKS